MPNRIIKESLLVSDKIASLSDFEFRVWVGLILSVDDAGRGDARPAIIKGRVFPLRERVSLKDIESAIHSLAAKGCVSLYTVGGKPYFWFPTWGNHQRIRDAKPKYPPPENADCGNPPQLAADCGNPPPESNPNPIRIQSESEDELRAREAVSRPAVPTDPKIAVVFTAYAEKIGPKSPMTEKIRDELLAFLDPMGADCCIRAMDEAVEAGKISWKYVRGVLNAKRAQGVRSIADWDATEKKRTEKSSNGIAPGTDFQPSTERIRRSNDWLDSFLADQDRIQKSNDKLDKFWESEKKKGGGQA